MASPTIGVIGGSGLYQMPGIERVREGKDPGDRPSGKASFTPRRDELGNMAGGEVIRADGGKFTMSVQRDHMGEIVKINVEPSK